MALLEECRIYCPYCGEPQTLLADDSAGDSEYTEDCQICCRPMIVTLYTGAEGPELNVRSEDEAY